ncbi:MAG: hypothetical protein ABFD81_02555, partial [Syntrophaceae bacterium]
GSNPVAASSFPRFCSFPAPESLRNNAKIVTSIMDFYCRIYLPAPTVAKIQQQIIPKLFMKA